TVLGRIRRQDVRLRGEHAERLPLGEPRAASRATRRSGAMNAPRRIVNRLAAFLLGRATLIMFVLIIAYFSVAAPGYLSIENAGNIVKQSSFVGIAAVGMTFVLLTAGIGLSVGAIMYLAPASACYAMGNE